MNIDWNFPESNYAQRIGISEAGIETFRGSLFGSLAKEICQNSLDARKDYSKPVIVEFSKFKINTENIPGFYSLNIALNKCLSTESDSKARIFFENACSKMANKTTNILRISDFNTTGLKGAKESPTSINPWNSLIKSSGISDKPVSSGGSYGIGKSAPFACSEIRTIFYTTYDIESVLATQGVSRLISFNAGEDRLTQGIGYYGETEKNTPVFNELHIDPNFKRAGEIGTDLYIISFLENSNWIEELSVAVLDNFLIAVYNGHLIVKIGEIVISRQTLDDIVEKFKIEDKKKYKSVFDYYKVLKSTSELSDSSNNFIVGDNFRDLGGFELRILYEDLNRRVLISRSNGMKIFDLDRFPSALRFSAVFIIKDENFNAYFREMETPQHDNWEPDRHHDKNAKNILRELKKLIRTKIIELGKSTTEEKIDAEGIGNFLPDNIVFLSNDKIENKIDKISNRTKNLDFHQVNSLPERKKKKKTSIDNEDFNNIDYLQTESGEELLLPPFFPSGNRKIDNNSDSEEKEFSILDNKSGNIEVKEVISVSDADIRLIILNKMMKKYKLIIVPKRNMENACIKISLSGEQTSMKAKIRSAYEFDDMKLPLIIKQDKIYINNLHENEKYSLSFILNYLDNCSMEVELYEYRT